MAHAAIRIVVGEAEYLAREGLVRSLEAAEGIEVVSVCSSLDALRAAATAERPDVVVMALDFPPGRKGGASNAIELAVELRRRCTGIGLLLLGDRPDFARALPLFDQGTARCGFILKDRIENAAELARGIREIAKGQSLVDPGAVGSFLTAPDLRADTRIGDLTAREHEVLALIAKAESNHAIARHLGITTRAVERHINSIFRKLGFNGNPDVNRRVKAALAFIDAARRPVGSSR